MDTEAAIDLSTRNRSSPSLRSDNERTDVATILRPIPRPAWSIIWYQKLWPHYSNATQTANQNIRHEYTQSTSSLSYNTNQSKSDLIYSSSQHTQCQPNQQSTNDKSDYNISTLYPPLERSEGQCSSGRIEENITTDEDPAVLQSKIATSVLDIACCDGPVQFERISNPNFALTVEHNNSDHSSTQSSNSSAEATRRSLATKTYLCIYCNQSFKSLFCYQKHKKRHLNPVSVDITASHLSTPRVTNFENKSKTKDLNVQFFPCKKCGCKFPSYYFVHKHKKICH